MMSERNVQPEVAAQMEACCSALFERWCEERRVIPLAYLMHAWPLATPSPVYIRRLSRSLHDLVVSHAESLGVDDCRLIADAIAIADRPARSSNRN
jgi:hypothetical protein